MEYLNNILEIDPNRDITRLIPFINQYDETWRGGVLALNGKIYGIPNKSATTSYILEFDPVTESVDFIEFDNPTSEQWWEVY